MPIAGPRELSGCGVPGTAAVRRRRIEARRRLQREVLVRGGAPRTGLGLSTQLPFSATATHGEKICNSGLGLNDKFLRVSHGNGNFFRTREDAKYFDMTMSFV